MKSNWWLADWPPSSGLAASRKPLNLRSTAAFFSASQVATPESTLPSVLRV